jgi:hypothetical protein
MVSVPAAPVSAAADLKSPEIVPEAVAEVNLAGPEIVAV